MRRFSSQKSFFISVAFHVGLALLLLLSFEKTIHIAAPPSEPAKIIDAVMINKETLQAEVKRLQDIEARKKAAEVARQKEIVRKENEAREKREKEEALALELKKKNEELKKQAQEEKIKAAKAEKERKEKIKKEAEDLKKIKKEKEEALLAKKKVEDERKLEEARRAKEAQEKELEQNAQNSKAKQDEITRYALLMRNKIHQNWRQPTGMDIKGFTCKIAVKLLPTGEVIDALVVESSGSLEFDRSTELAIRKASPLPMPSDPTTAKEFHHFTFTFRPETA